MLGDLPRERMIDVQECLRQPEQRGPQLVLDARAARRVLEVLVDQRLAPRGRLRVDVEHRLQPAGRARDRAAGGVLELGGQVRMDRKRVGRRKRRQPALRIPGVREGVPGRFPESEHLRSLNVSGAAWRVTVARVRTSPTGGCRSVPMCGNSPRAHHCKIRTRSPSARVGAEEGGSGPWHASCMTTFRGAQGAEFTLKRAGNSLPPDDTVPVQDKLYRRTMRSQGNNRHGNPHRGAVATPGRRGHARQCASGRQRR